MTEPLIETRLQETLNDLRIAREEYQALAKRLEDAENTIRFYGEPQSYKVTFRSGHDGTVYQDRVSGDWEPAANTDSTQVAGRRARGYLKRYEG